MIYVRPTLAVPSVWATEGDIGTEQVQQRFNENFFPLIQRSHLRVVDGDFMWPHAAPYIHEVEKYHLGCSVKHEEARLFGAFKFWASGLLHLCAYANACVRSHSQAPGFEMPQAETESVLTISSDSLKSKYGLPKGKKILLQHMKPEVLLQAVENVGEHGVPSVTQALQSGTGQAPLAASRGVSLTGVVESASSGVTSTCFDQTRNPTYAYAPRSRGSAQKRRSSCRCCSRTSSDSTRTSRTCC